MANKLLFEPVWAIMEPSSRSMSTIPSPYLEQLIGKIANSDSNLEIKRTAAAKIGRTEIPDLGFYPKPILLVRCKNLMSELTETTNSTFHLPCVATLQKLTSVLKNLNKKRKIKASFEQEDAKQIIYSIWLSKSTSRVICKIEASKCYTRRSGQKYPCTHSLDEMISLIEELFENNNEAIQELKDTTKQLEQWISPVWHPSPKR